MLVEASAMQLMAHRIEYFCRAEHRAVSVREAQAARDAHDFMCRHLQRSPTVAEIAAVCRIPARRLELAYRDVFGVSLYNNMVTLRFDAMCAALREGVPVKRVAHQFGYANPSNFTYAFRKKMGMPPRQWLQHFGRH
ncbi:helix-turn-helix domain-containing protein [Shimia sp. MIT1388]|uniref:helix-turn-helix domain-containing protein n=1 Tax=Shimia sp. MIT1388 TaxID=3096992 RepID=UPI00399B8661